MTDPQRILDSARTILLVDWASPRVPRALLEAGFTVFSFSPGRYSSAEVVAVRPEDVDAGSIFPPQGNHEAGFLVFRKRSDGPAGVDIVNTYRPAEELPGIITNIVVPLCAKTLWLQPPCSSHEARRIAKEHGLSFVESSDIADVVQLLRARTPK